MPEITVKTEFKSCPFCSSENIKVEQMEQDNGIKVWVCWCKNCGSLGPTHLNWSGAIEMWNLRRSQKPLVAALEEIKKGEGPYSQDRQTHAENTINHLVLIATQALAQVEGDQS